MAIDRPYLRLRAGACEIDVGRGECWLHGQPLRLQRPLLDLICLLAERRPAIVTHADLLRRIWPGVAAASQLLVGAIVEARRALGDNPSKPQYIVHVHGVGYRFDGPVIEEGLPADGEFDGAVCPRAVCAARLQQARQAYTVGGALDVSQRHAEAALVLALQHGLGLERGQALHWLGWLALSTGQTEAAGRNLGQAAKIAADERDVILQAQVQVADALLRSAIGDLNLAQAQLVAAHRVLVRHGGPALERCHCEDGLARVAAELGGFEAAQAWNHAAIESARAAGAEALAHRCRVLGLVIDLRAGEACERAGEPQRAHRIWVEALRRCEALVAALDSRAAPAEGLPPRDPWEINLRHGALLARLGRWGEAHQRLHALAHLGSDQTRGTVAAGQKQIEACAELARLLQREGRSSDALRVLEWALQKKADDDGWPDRVSHCALAAELAQACGHLDLALHWSRRQLTSQRDEEHRSRLLTR